MDGIDYLRHREVAFRGPCVEPEPAQAALLLLADIEPIRAVRLLDRHRLLVTYDVRQLVFHELEAALEELGLHLDNSLIAKLRRAFYRYAEETLRANLGIQPADVGHNAKSIFIQNYRNQRHGCRDGRPRHWRQYL
ncbi:MAG: hypothetical protein PHQ14_05855 [Chromatiales bacterium]|jgi:hypothetical protein|nr:hypothetical protein [Chromatiales bacterium]MDX9768097.1 hypothetical protein [Ectothiorhodospiraceae bacterium]